MKAQAYFDSDTCIRVFNRKLMLAELPLGKADCSDRAMDAALRRVRLARVGPWKETDWGAEAKVEFMTGPKS